MKHGGIIGFVIFKNADEGWEMDVLRDDTGAIVLFTEYNDAKSESDWLDVVSPVAQERFEKLCRPKAPKARKKKGARSPYAWVVYPTTTGGRGARKRRKTRGKQAGYKGRGSVYLIRAKGLGGIYKIGQSLDPQRRLQTVQTHSPVPLEIAYTITNKNGGNIERALHRRFENSWIHHEWFRLNAQDIDWIRHNYTLRPRRDVPFAP